MRPYSELPGWHVAARIALAIAIGASLAACERKPADQASSEADRTIRQAPPAAGQPASKSNDASSGMTEDSTAQQSPAPARPDDVALSAKIEDALKSDFSLRGLPIIVQTSDGVVTLSGTADSQANRQQAEQIARAISGVKSVQNKLRISGG